MPVSISTVKSPEASDAGRPQAVADLDVAEIRQNLIVEQLQAVADAKVVLGKFQGFLCGKRVTGDREFGAADFLPTEQVAYRLDGGVLILQVGLKMQFQWLSLLTGCAHSPARTAGEWR